MITNLTITSYIEIKVCINLQQAQDQLFVPSQKGERERERVGFQLVEIYNVLRAELKCLFRVTT